MNRRGQDRTGALGGSGMVGLWGASSLIESIEVIQVTINSGSVAYGDATLTQSVDTSRTVVVYGHTGIPGASTGTNRNDVQSAYVTLQSSTTVRATRAATTTSVLYVYATVIQYRPGVLKSVQYGTVTITASPADVTLSQTVNSSKAYGMFLGVSNGLTAASLERLTGGIRLISNTAVRSDTATLESQVVGYVVVEFF